jgi:DNA-binding NarL/FixJ family response regulator
MRIMIVDNHDVVRRGLRSVLELEQDVVVVAEVGDRAGTLQTIPTARPGIVLLDLKLGSGGPAEGLELVEEIARAHPEVAVVVFTAFVTEDLARDAVRRGARGYVQKDVDVVELLRILRGVQGGGAGFDSHTARLLIGRGDAGDSHQLTVRERQILRLVAAGCTNREIAQQCFISEGTVKYHIRSMFHRLGVSHRAELARWAGEVGEELLECEAATVSRAPQQR